MTDAEGERARAALHFLVIWFAVVLIFFSIPRSKLGEYILPGLPPIAILAARGLAWIEKITAAQRRMLFMIFAVINTAFAIAIGVVVVIAPAHELSRALTGDLLIVAIALLVGGLASVVLASRGLGGVASALAISVIAAMGAGINARERIAPLVSYRELAKTIAPYAGRGCRLMSYGHFEQALPFYTGTRETLVNYRGELEPFGPLHDPGGKVFATSSQLKKAWAGARCVVLVANRVDLPTLAGLLSPAPALIGCEGKKLALYNHPVATPAEVLRGCLKEATGFFE
jgi:hypothetical protein